MIIGHDHRFIFLKTNKTAGTSIEIALSRFCGERDVITPISNNDEQSRKELGYRGSQNYRVPTRQYWRRLMTRRPRKFYNHMTATEVRDLVPKETWDGYYKFCVERNPWDRAVSRYFWVHKKEPRPPIHEFVFGGGLVPNKERGYGVYSIDDEVAVDRVLRYENLDSELEEVAEQLGLPEKLQLPQAKSGYRPKRHYRDVLCPKTRDYIADLFKVEIELFGYEY